MIRILGHRSTAPLEACVRPQAKETQEQTLLEARVVKRRPGAGASEIGGKVHAEIGFLQDIEQAGHGPAAQNLRFQVGARGGRRESSRAAVGEF